MRQVTKRFPQADCSARLILPPFDASLALLSVCLRPPDPPFETARLSPDSVRRIQRRLVPRSLGPPMGDVRDICFSLVESRDLKVFNGTWRIEGNARSARLLYTVEVQPQPWLPIGAPRMLTARTPPCPAIRAPERPTLDSHPSADCRSRVRVSAGLVVDRVSKDLKGNLSAVRDYAETLSQNAMVVVDTPPAPPPPAGKAAKGGSSSRSTAR